MIDTLNETDTDAAPAVAQFDLRQMTYGDVLRIQNGTMTQNDLDALLARIYRGNLGPLEHLSVVDMGYVWQDFWDAVNDAQSPKARGSAS